MYIYAYIYIYIYMYIYIYSIYSAQLVYVRRKLVWGRARAR